MAHFKYLVNVKGEKDYDVDNFLTDAGFIAHGYFSAGLCDWFRSDDASTCVFPSGETFSTVYRVGCENELFIKEKIEHGQYLTIDYGNDIETLKDGDVIMLNAVRVVHILMWR